MKVLISQKIKYDLSEIEAFLTNESFSNSIIIDSKSDFLAIKKVIEHLSSKSNKPHKVYFVHDSVYQSKKLSRIKYQDEFCNFVIPHLDVNGMTIEDNFCFSTSTEQLKYETREEGFARHLHTFRVYESLNLQEYDVYNMQKLYKYNRSELDDRAACYGWDKNNLFKFLYNFLNEKVTMDTLVDKNYPSMEAFLRNTEQITELLDIVANNYCIQ